MALASNALTSVASLEAYMRRPLPDSDLMTIYHDQSVSATAATVQVTATTMVLVITGGANAGTQTLTLATSATITALKTAIDALDEGWVVRAFGSGSADPERLKVVAATDAYGSANELWLQGVDTYQYEQTINAASDVLERYCGRTFASATYRQLYSGPGRDQLRLRNWPVSAVKRVAVGRISALSVANSSSDAKEATASNDLTTLTFTVYGGDNDTESSPDTVTIGTNTVAQLVVLINALGNGWTANASSNAESWKGTELFKTEAVGALDIAVNFFVPNHAEEDIRLDGASGILRRGFGTEPFFQKRRRTHLPAHIPYLADIGGDIWPEGQFNVYVNYTGGYAAIPFGLEMLCNELAATMLRSGARDSGLTSESGAGYSYSASGELWMNESFRARLGLWRSFPPFPEYVDV